MTAELVTPTDIGPALPDPTPPGDGPARVRAADGLVTIDSYTTADPDTYQLLAQTSSPGEAVAVLGRILSTGAATLRIGHSRLDTATVETAFTDLVATLGDLVERGSIEVGAAAGAVLNDPNDGLTARLDAWQRALAALFDATFNPARDGSALHRLDQMLAAATERQTTQTRQLLSPDREDGPFPRVLSAMREQVATVLDAVAKLSEQIAVDKAATAATRAAWERSAVKGLDYETQVGQIVTDIAAVHGDVAHRVGAEPGVHGAKTGDLVVTLDPDQTDDARYVLECKDRRVSLPAILTELAKAGDNRDARAAIAVFSRPGHAPVTEPFTTFGTRAIVVYDKDDPDPTALRVACAWARWIAQRDTRPGHEQPDHGHIAGLLTDARRALTRRASVRAALATATKKIGEAGGHIDELHTDLGDVLTKLELALAR